MLNQFQKSIFVRYTIFYLDAVTQKYPDATEKNIRIIVSTKLKNAPGQKGGLGRNTEKDNIPP